MKFIGITGGIGAGKSTILAYLRENYRVRTLVADEIAHSIMEPGFDCYVRLQKEFAQEKIWLHNGRINRKRLAEVIFADDAKREKMNQIVHPAVKEYILKEVEKERLRGVTDYVVLEAALLIEEGYDKICDELWYIYVTRENRKRRLMEGRGYSEEKVEQIFASQLPDVEYRRHCRVIIDNNGPIGQVYLQLAQLLRGKGEKQMGRTGGQQDTQEEKKQFVFGLDIGTRNVVGTVGYKKDKEFIVVAQHMEEHETRAMLDGQIHDIGRVGRTISLIKEKLEDQIGEELTEVCIAAAGRVLKTVTTEVEYEFPEETIVTREHIHTLDLLGVDKAAQELKEKNDTNYKFYCVGYSIMKYYLNGEIFSNLESHKADKISEKIIVTFLPEDVVDGLYMAVGFAGLTVANMTLEPIAAMDIAVPENFRMLNIALVDVGAGTSDISLTKDGSIIAYGMIPFAGDELTETIVQHYLVDFKMAEHIKLSSAEDAEIEFEDIMSLQHKIKSEEVWKLTDPLVDQMTTDIAGKIKELNGDQTVSATFIVGGGGKIHGFADMLAKKLELPQERVALRGEEVLKTVTFVQEDIHKDPLLVTPIGICLNYYEQKNNFIMVHFNGERLKLYDNNKLTIVDAAIQAGFPNGQLFPKRGREINYTVNGRPRIARGEVGEAAVVRMNDKPASINDPIEPNCYITIEPSTAGEQAHYTVGELDEYQSSTIVFEVNGRMITCPRYVEVNGILEPPTYEIKEGDAVVTRSFYTVAQLAEFMDVELDPYADILVNNRVEGLQALVYENFSVDWTVLNYRSTPQDAYPKALPKNLAAIMEIGDQDSQTAAGSTPAQLPAAGAQAQLPAVGTQAQPAVISAQTRANEDETATAKAEVKKIEAKERKAIEGATHMALTGPTQAKPAGGVQPQVKGGADRMQPAAGMLSQPTGAASNRRQPGAGVPSGVASGSQQLGAGVQPNVASDIRQPGAGVQPSAASGSRQPDASVQPTGTTAGRQSTTGVQPLPAEAVGNRQQTGNMQAQQAGEFGNQKSAAGIPQPTVATGSRPAASVSQPQSGVSSSVQPQSDVSTSSQPSRLGAQPDLSGAVVRSQSSGGIQQQVGTASNQPTASGQQPVGTTSNRQPAAGQQPSGTASIWQSASGQQPSGTTSSQPSAAVQQPIGTTSSQPSAAVQQPVGTTGIQQPAASSVKPAQSAADVQPQFQVVINGETVPLGNKEEYIFVDIFDHFSFDLSQAKGRMLITKVNDIDAQYTQTLHNGDKIDIYWKEF